MILFGNHAVDGKELSNLFSSEYTRYHEVILGDMGDQYISLIHCQLSQVKPIGKNIKQIKYHVNTIFRDIHFDSINELQVFNILVRFTWLDSWIDGMRSFNKVETIEVDKIDQKITHDFKIDENTSIQFMDSLWEKPIIGSNTLEKQYDKYLILNFQNAINYDRCIEYVITFKRLLDFCNQRSNSIYLSTCETETQYLRKYEKTYRSDSRYKFQITNYSLEENEIEQVNAKYQREMIISGWSYSVRQMMEIIKMWFSQTELNHIHDIYLNSITIEEKEMSNVTYNNACLNLLQSLEDIHRKKYGNDKHDRATFELTKKEVLRNLNKDPKLKKWTNDRLNFTKTFSFKERIEKLIIDAEVCIVEILESIVFYEEFPKLAKDFRNNLSHASFKTTYQGEIFNYVYALTKLLLTIHLMKSLNIQDSEISNSLQKTNFVRELKRSIYPIYKEMKN